MAEAAVQKAKGGKKTGGFLSFYTRGEEIFNAVSHIAGGALGLAAWIALGVIAYPDAAALAAVSVFCVSVVILYTMSALYHFLPDGRAKGVFRVFDHCNIYLLIAGTYTPFCLIPLFGTAVGWAVLAVEWACAAAGVVMNAIAMNNKAVKRVSMALYLCMGWLALFVIPQAVAAPSRSCLLFVLFGGIAYTAGVAFYAFGKRVRYFHAVWHLFVVLGTVLQFVSILLMML